MPPPRIGGWVAAGALAVPFTTLLHELGHYAIYHLAGAPELKLHYSSVSFVEAAVPKAIFAAGEIAGPLVSLLILGVALLIVRFVGPAPAAIALGLAAALRSVILPALAGILILRWILHNHAPLAANVDEFNAARLAGIPALPLIAGFTSFVAGATAILIRSIPSGQRLPSLVWLCAGMSLGAGAYFLYLGPRLLP